MAKRQPVTSLDSAVAIAQGACREIAPPSHVPLDDMDWPYWHSVVAEFARAEWTEHQLELAAMLARTMANLEQEQRALRAEGFIAVRENGTTVENPRSRAVKSLMGDVFTARRSLALHARARGGDNRDVGTRKAAGKAIENGLANGDALFAVPGG